MHPHKLFQTIHSTFSRIFARATESARSMGGCNFENNLPINVPKCYRRAKFSDKKRSTFLEFYSLESGNHPYITDIAETMNSHIQETDKYSESCITVTLSPRTQKVEMYLANE